MTDAGRAYLDRARKLLAEFDQANREAAARQTTPAGVLRVTLPSAFDYVISPVLAAFAAENPEVSLDLLISNRALDLLDEHVDVAIRGGILPDSNLMARKLVAMEVLVCASPSYIDRRGAPTSIDDLPDHDCISYTERASGDAWTFVDAAGGTKRVVQFTHIRHRANSAEGQRALALAGLGLVQIPEPLVRADIAEGRLVRLLEHLPEAKRWLQAVYLPGRKLPLATRTLINFLETRLIEL